MNITNRTIQDTDPYYKDFQALGLKANIVVFDFETSGLDPQEDRPIEAALIRITPKGVLTIFQTLIHYPKALPAKITEITGITQAMLQGQPEYEKAMASLYEHMGIPLSGENCNTWMVGHNFIKFDMEFLRQFTMVRYPKPADLNYWDTAGHYKAEKLSLKKKNGESMRAYHLRALETRRKGLFFKLVQCCDENGIKSSGSHRALADVEMTLQLFLKQCLEMKEKKATAVS